MGPVGGSDRSAGRLGGRGLSFQFDGEEIAAAEGQSIAAALLAAGRRVWRWTAERGEPRGLFCGMGVCYDCLVEVDGRPNQRACQTPVVAGMRVRSQHGAGSWEV
jgi:predicted molibdopterin-dependent oxidoreductase YjgC